MLIMEDKITLSLMPFSSEDIRTEDSKNKCFNQININGNNNDHFQELDPDINYYNETCTCNYYNVSQFKLLRKEKN